MPAFITGTERVSISAGGVEGNLQSGQTSVSGNGRYVAFVSDASNLVAGDTNGVADVFVKDLQTGAITRIGPAGAGANGAASFPAISEDGQNVIFISEATNLVAGDTNGRKDLFIAHWSTGDIDRVSVSAAGRQASHISDFPSAISADNRYVVFASVANNLVSNDTNGKFDVFLKDLQTGTVTLISANVAGVPGDAFSSEPNIAGSGRYIAFETYASNIVPGDTNNSKDAFVRDLQTGTVTRVSELPGIEGNDDSYEPVISDDGRVVAFSSRASNLLALDTNGRRDVYVVDRQTGELSCVSTNAAGEIGNGDSDKPAISADGRFVTFASYASNLVAGDTNGVEDVFVKDLLTGEIARVSVNAAGVGGNGHSFEPQISADGRTITFYSRASNLVAGDTNGVQDVFVNLNPLFRDGMVLLTIGDDSWTGSAASESVTGRAGDDSLAGSGGADSLAGNAGDDTLSGGSGADTLAGGDGDDRYYVGAGDRIVGEQVGGGTDRVYSGVSFTLGDNLNHLYLTGTAAVDGTGNDIGNVIGGNAAANLLQGLGGADRLYGRDGDDTLDGGAGADTLSGGDGSDNYIVDATDVIIDEQSGGGVDRVYSSGSFTLGDNLNHLYLTGTAAIDGTGNNLGNVIGGNSGANQLTGLGGSDNLFGFRGNDTLDGGAGSDTLHGEAGSDRLTGGTGADRFAFGSEVGDAVDDADVITDYSRAQGDVVDLPDPNGYTVVGVVGGALVIRLDGGDDTIRFEHVTAIDDILFV